MRDVLSRASHSREAWVRTGRVQSAAKFVESLVSGRWAPLSEAEAWASGMWDAQHGRWDEEILDQVGGGREEGRRVRGWLGEVQQQQQQAQPQTISRYMCERYGFRSDTLVHAFTMDVLATYAGMCPARGDAVVSFGPTDVMVAEVGPGPWAKDWLEREMRGEMVVVPHPWPTSGASRRYLALLSAPNADVARALVRDMYTKSWSAFDRLVAIVPPGGSIGEDWSSDY